MSPADEKYHQCELQKGTAHQIAWIAARGAKIGAVVDLLDEEDGEGWTVISVNERPISKFEVILLRDAHRYQRKASDI